jgi:hypothetical protein
MKPTDKVQRIKAVTREMGVPQIKPQAFFNRYHEILTEDAATAYAEIAQEAEAQGRALPPGEKERRMRYVLLCRWCGRVATLIRRSLDRREMAVSQ